MVIIKTASWFGMGVHRCGLAVLHQSVCVVMGTKDHCRANNVPHKTTDDFARAVNATISLSIINVPGGLYF